MGSAARHAAAVFATCICVFPVAARAAVGDLSHPAVCTSAPARPLKAETGPRLVPFDASPFPYRGSKPSDGQPFMDKLENGRLGHTAPRGGVHWEDETYSNRNTLIYMPRGFTPSPRALIVIFFHGNQTELTRDVVQRQQIPRQLAASGLNAALIAPQFAVDANDSSAGHFWEPGFFRKYLAEAARHLAEIYGDRCAQPAFEAMRIVLVAYSGGYNGSAYALQRGGADGRIHGVALFDALYGETEKFEDWIERRGPAFFFSAYSDSSQVENLALQRSLKQKHQRIRLIARPPARLRLARGSITFLAAGTDVQHKDFMTAAWAANPLTAVLAGIDGPHIAARKPAKH